MIDIEKRYDYNFPTRIRFGIGVIDEIPAYLKAEDLTCPLIVTDPNISNLPFFKRFIKSLHKKGLKAEVFSNINKNPIKSDVLSGRDHYEKTGRDSILGIGGGVSMDVARAIALSINNRRDLFEYDDLIGGSRFITGDIPPFITIPTTSGTGSEVGRSSIISEDISKKKRILFHPKLMARIVFADPQLTMDLPPFITAATGMDALTHLMEAYLVSGYHPMCDGIALEGIRLIGQSLEKATHKPDLANRSDMLIASLMGAVAFQKGLGVVHSLAHPLSSLLDTHHGLANAVNLPYGMAFNYVGSESKFDSMANAFGAGHLSGENLSEFLSIFNSRLELPVRLSDIGVKKSHIPELSRMAVEDFAHPNNPKPVSRKDFETLYERAL